MEGADGISASVVGIKIVLERDHIFSSYLHTSAF